MFVTREDEVRVWRGCKPEGLKRRLGGGLGEADGPTGKATVQIARYARLQSRQFRGRAYAHILIYDHYTGTPKFKFS